MDQQNSLQVDSFRPRRRQTQHSRQLSAPMNFSRLLPSQDAQQPQARESWPANFSRPFQPAQQHHTPVSTLEEGYKALNRTAFQANARVIHQEPAEISTMRQSLPPNFSRPVLRWHADGTQTSTPPRDSISKPEIEIVPQQAQELHELVLDEEKVHGIYRWRHSTGSIFAETGWRRPSFIEEFEEELDPALGHDRRHSAPDWLRRVTSRLSISFAREGRRSSVMSISSKKSQKRSRSWSSPRRLSGLLNSAEKPTPEIVGLDGKVGSERRASIGSRRRESIESKRRESSAQYYADHPPPERFRIPGTKTIREAVPDDIMTPPERRWSAQDQSLHSSTERRRSEKARSKSWSTRDDISSDDSFHHLQPPKQRRPSSRDQASGSAKDGIQQKDFAATEVVESTDSVSPSFTPPPHGRSSVSPSSSISSSSSRDLSPRSSRRTSSLACEGIEQRDFASSLNNTIPPSLQADVGPRAGRSRRRGTWAPSSSRHTPSTAGLVGTASSAKGPARTRQVSKAEEDVSPTRKQAPKTAWTFTDFNGVKRPDFTEKDPRRPSAWPGRLDIRRRMSVMSPLGRRLSEGIEAVFGSDRRQSVFARATEGIFAPTAEEAATYYHTPSVAAFDVDLEALSEGQKPPVDPARSLTKRELLYQRLFFGSVIFALNATCIIVSAIGYSGTWVLCVILFFKSKDFLSVWLQIICRTYNKIKPLFSPMQVGKKASWILSLIPAYSESEEQIVKTLFSLRDNGTGEHRQVMCVILDGKPRPIKSHMTKVVASFERKYVSLKWKIGKLQVDAGFVDDIPTLCIEKSPNAGKKDSLILCHDLFNHPRDNMDAGVRDLREELWSAILPQLTQIEGFKSFDLVFCTDADSTIHQGALASLADACLADPKAIAACGFVFVEYEPGLEWSAWNMYQQFQYSFGQIVRRGAEHFWGKVSCLPGCITMIVVRPEMAGAIKKYARPVTTFPVLRHQVQYLGTDRRLTYSMLSQAPYLHTLFVPEAGSETVAPQSLKHYLSQRRRWGSNAYFNNYFYFAGDNMIWITRIAALIEISRLTMVYYRVVNTALFLKGLAAHFNIVGLLPLIFISFTPTVWFAFCVFFLNDHLRRNKLKLFCGFCINRCIAPFMSCTIFSLVARNLGSQVWGISGVTAGTNVTPAAAVRKLSAINEQQLAAVQEENEEEDALDAMEVVP